MQYRQVLDAAGKHFDQPLHTEPAIGAVLKPQHLSAPADGGLAPGILLSGDQARSAGFVGAPEPTATRGGWTSMFARRFCRACGQSRARRHGIAGIYGNRGIVDSVTYRIQGSRESPNPTLSASLRSRLARRLSAIAPKARRRTDASSRSSFGWQANHLYLTTSCREPAPVTPRFTDAHRERERIPLSATPI